MTTTKSDLYRLHMCNNYNYNLSNLRVDRFYPVEGKMCKLVATKKFDGYTQYQFADWRLGGGRVYTVYHNADAEVERFDKLGDWSKDSVLDGERRLCHGKIVETLSQCEITDTTAILDWKAHKSRQDKDVADFYEARPHLNHD